MITTYTMTTADWFAGDALAAWLILALALVVVSMTPSSTLARQWRALTRGRSE